MLRLYVEVWSPPFCKVGMKRTSWAVGRLCKVLVLQGQYFQDEPNVRACIPLPPPVMCHVCCFRPIYTLPLEDINIYKNQPGKSITISGNVVTSSYV